MPGSAAPAPSRQYGSAMALPRIHFIAFGGTISSTASVGGGPVTPTLGAAGIVATVPELAEIAQVEPGDFPTIASYAVTPADMLALAREVQRALATGVDGVVITHGTDTIEETAYVLALTLPRTAPVVLTGAMRNASQTGSEGPANLLAAFQVAASPSAAGLGPLVVVNDEIHSARFVTKLHTSKASTFGSPAAGPLGEVTEGRADIWWTPAWDDLLGLPEAIDGHTVELVVVAAGLSDVTMRAATAARPAGIVLESTGGGHLPPPLLPALEEMVAQGIPVVLATRGIAGATLERTYAMVGAEIDLQRIGAIPVGRLNGPKARLRLLVGQALGLEPRALFPVR